MSARLSPASVSLPRALPRPSACNAFRATERCKFFPLIFAAQDRATTILDVLGNADVFFCGVFDGTVNDFAADTVHREIGRHVCHAGYLAAAVDAAHIGGGADYNDAEPTSRLRLAMREGFLSMDQEVLALCKDRHDHYSSSTAAAVLVAGTCLIVAHIGDSRVVLGKESFRGGPLSAEVLTEDHKPDMPAERARIEAVCTALSRNSACSVNLNASDTACLR